MKTNISLKSESGINIILRSMIIKPMPNNAGFLIQGNDRTLDKHIAAFSTAQEVLVFLGSILLPKTELTFIDKDLPTTLVNGNNETALQGKRAAKVWTDEDEESSLRKTNPKLAKSRTYEDGGEEDEEED